MIRKIDLMIGDVVNSPKDLIRMKVSEIKKDSVTLVSLDGTTTSERDYEEIDPLVFFDDRIFKAMGFVDREIKTTAWEPAKVDRIIQLFNKEDNSIFATITVIKDETKNKWKAEITDNNFYLAGGGFFEHVHELQNIVRSCTGLEFTIEGL